MARMSVDIDKLFLQIYREDAKKCLNLELAPHLCAL